MDEYAKALQRLVLVKARHGPRNEWCATSFYERAKAAETYSAEQMKAAGLNVEPVSLYKAFYRSASSMHHGDIGGLIAQVDSDLNVELAPSWSWLDEALINGLGSFVRMLGRFNEIAGLDFKEPLQNGPKRITSRPSKTCRTERPPGLTRLDHTTRPHGAQPNITSFMSGYPGLIGNRPISGSDNQCHVKVRKMHPDFRAKIASKPKQVNFRIPFATLEPNEAPKVPPRQAILTTVSSNASPIHSSPPTSKQ